MPAQYPQYDINISGASDQWDQPQASIILQDDFFGSQSPIGRLKVWDGSTWVLKALKVWDGSVWQTKTLKVWDGSVWV